jgi:hypothetical protein
LESPTVDDSFVVKIGDRGADQEGLGGLGSRFGAEVSI